MSDDPFPEADKFEFRGIRAVLTKRDMATLQAMGLSAMRLAPEELTGAYKGALRDAILTVWLATRDTDGKKKAFRNPDKANDDAFDWHETECAGSMDGLADLYVALMENVYKASPDFVPESGGDLPP